MFVRGSVLAAAISVVFGAGCMSSSERQATRGEPQGLFLSDAAQSYQGEIELSRIALRKATDPQVKQFAQMMVDDHTGMLSKVRATASQAGMTVPERVDEAHARTATALENMSGAQFDREYIGQMVADHQKAVSMFEDKERNASDPATRSLASQQLPMLREHLRQAQEIQKNLPATPQGTTTPGSTAPTTTPPGTDTTTPGTTGS
jgi:putative membrane protein